MWNRIDPNLIAIVTEDNVMRIWDIGSKTTTKPIKDLNHSKVMSVVPRASTSPSFIPLWDLERVQIPKPVLLEY